MAAVPSRAESALANVLLRHQVMLQRLTEAERQKFVPFLREMDRSLRERLTREELTELSRARLEKLLSSVDAMLKELLGDYQGQMLASLEEIAMNEASFSARAITNIVEMETVIPSPTQIRVAILNNPLSVRSRGRNLLKPFIQDWTQSQRNAVSNLIRQSVFEGRTNAQIVQLLRGTKALNYADGLLETTARQARAVVHTAVQHVSSQARQATFDENKDIVEKVRWISTLDSKTCASCRTLDHREFNQDKGPRPPLHPQCRCTIGVVLSEEFRFMQEGGKRAAVGDDGAEQVDASLDYYHWLKTQPREFVELALGSKRAKLFLEGGLSPERFAALQLDRNWQPLTLDEMRKLEPIAFMRAGL